MLEGLRKGIGGFATKVLLALLIVSFAVWGIADVFRGFGGQTVAKIGSTEISVELFRRAFTERLQEIGRQVGRGLTTEQARAYGIDRQVLSELVTDAALDEKAKTMRLAISDEMLADRVRNYPGFKGPDGNFSAMRYQQVLQANNYSEATYLVAERKLAARQQLLTALAGDAPPAALRDALWRFTNEQRTIEFVRLTRAQAGEIPAPSEADLKTYFEANKASFRAPEYRKLEIIQLSPASLMSTIKISDDELKKAYEDNTARFTTPERRAAEQISFPSADAAKAASERLAKGESFEDVAKDLKLEIVSLGQVAKSDILDPAVADAVFSLAPNTASAPVAGRFGTVIVRVTKVEPSKVSTLEEVSKALRDQLALERAYTLTQTLHDKIEDERGAGATLAEAAAKLKVPLTMIEAIDRSGRKLDGNPVINVPSLEVILNGAFATQKNVETEAIELRETRSTIWYEVADIMPARERTFEEAKASVETRWKDDQAAKKLNELAAEIQKKLDAGETLAAAAPGLRGEKAEAIRRNAQVPGIDANTITRIFLTQQDKAGIGTPENSIDRIVFRVTGITVPETAASAELTQRLTQSIQEDLQVQYVNQLQTQLGLRVNDAAFRQVTGDTRN